MFNIIKPTMYYFKLTLYFLLAAIGFVYLKWYLFGTSPFFQRIDIKLLEGVLFGSITTYVGGARFANLPLKEYWIVKVFQKTH